MSVDKNINKIIKSTQNALLGTKEFTEFNDAGEFSDSKTLSKVRGETDFQALSKKFTDDKLLFEQLNKHPPEHKSNLRLIENLRIALIAYKFSHGLQKNIIAYEKFLKANSSRKKNLRFEKMMHNLFFKITKNLESQKIFTLISDQSCFFNFIYELISKDLLIPNIKKDNKEKLNNNSKTTETNFDDINKKLNEFIKNSYSRLKTDNTTKNNIKKFAQINETIGYKIYTKLFDKEVKAKQLVEITDLKRLRTRLDTKFGDLKQATYKQAQLLKRKLISKHYELVKYNLEDGIIDSRKFSYLVTNPLYSHYYKKTYLHNSNKAAITLLIDNSGSMQGKPIAIAALCADILSQTLETIHIKTEILGFTTSSWRGGKSYKKWQNNGEPKNPGRLNDILHIIYKDFSSSYNSQKMNLGAMLKEGFLKENIDGEALLWAANRLKKQDAMKKILIVVSDGAPIDDSTLSINGSEFLCKHLQYIIRNIQDKTNIELLAIGIGHDVKKYYKKAVVIENALNLADVLFKGLEELL